MISPDLPITKSSEDKLNREAFAKSLANVILQSNFPTSFTVGLYGAWGSGKTSLLNMVIEQVEHSSTDVVILRFNPWLCSDPKQLITQYFKQLASAIKMKKPASDTVFELVDQYADIFDAASIIPYAGTTISALAKVFKSKAKYSLQGTTRRPRNGLLTTNGAMLPARGIAPVCCGGIQRGQRPIWHTTLRSKV